MIRRFVPSAVLWGLVLLAVAVVATAHRWRMPAWFAAPVRAGSAGPRIDPNRDDADSAWMRRKLEDDPDFVEHREARRLARRSQDPASRYTPEQLGPSPKDVVEAMGRKGFPSPDDVVDPER